MQTGNWDDYRYVLAVAQAGALAAAARDLGVNHATVLRHVNAFEATHGVRIFHRHAAGYALTGDGEQLLEALRAVREAVETADRRLAERAAGQFEPVRLTTTESIFSAVMTPHLPSFRTAYPDIVLEVSVTNAPVAPGSRGADVAVRPSLSPPDALVGRRVAPLGFGIYAERGYAQACGGMPLPEHCWVGLGESLGRSPPAQWMRRTIPEQSVVFGVDSFTAVRDVVARGLGVGILPCCVGDETPGLGAVLSPVPELETGLWLLTHASLREVSGVRAFLDHFGARLSAERGRLAGTSPLSA